MKATTKSLFILSAVALAPACGAFKTKSKGQKLKQNDTKLAAEWLTDCQSANKVLDLNRVSRDIRFSAVGDLDKRDYYFADNDCKQRAITYQITGTYDAVGAPSGTNTKNLNLTVDKVLVKVDTDRAAEALNKAKLCEVSDWKAGDEKDVTGKKCLNLQVKKGDVIYDVYRVDDKTLYLGNIAASLGAHQVNLTSRPNKVDEGVMFKKK